MLIETQVLDKLKTILGNSLRSIEAHARATHKSDALKIAGAVMMRDDVLKEIEAEFTPVTFVWCAEEHRGGTWCLRNSITGERYTSRSRGDGQRVVPFKTRAAAERKAAEKNREILGC